MWEEILKDTVWAHEKFLDKKLFESLLKFVKKSPEIEINPSNAHYLAHTNKIRLKADYTDPILTKLNKQYQILIGKVTNTTGLSSLQFVSKYAEPNISRYDLHKESPSLYGECVFMYYLTDEKDGELEIPYLNFKFLPKKNTCLIMRNGPMHKVNPCSGRRYALTGWSFAPHTRIIKELRRGYDQL